MNNEKYRLVFPSMAITRKAYLVFKFFTFHLIFGCKVTTFSLRFTNLLSTFFKIFLKRYICCSVAVLQFSRTISHTKKYFYIYI